MPPLVQVEYLCQYRHEIVPPEQVAVCETNMCTDGVCAKVKVRSMTDET